MKCMIMMDTVARNSIYNIIKNYAEDRLPGFIQALNMYCRKFSGDNDFINLLLSEPWTLRDLLVRLLGSVTAVKLLSRVFLYSIISRTRINKTLDELEDLFINNPGELHKIIQENVSLSASLDITT